MKVIKADTLGYCMGVRRAVESAEVALKEYHDKKVYSLGPLIHNPTALEELSKKGLNIIEEKDIENLDSSSVVIIRAHGVSPEIKNKLVSKNVSIIDATCPRVTVSQNRVAEYSKEGYDVILSGDRGHAEVEGIKGFCKGNFYCVQNLEEMTVLVNSTKFEKCLLLSQTTFSEVEFGKIAELAQKKIPSVKIINTICPATRERQEALERLCQKVEGIIVIGGRHSANTLRLYQKAAGYVKNAIHIETADEIPPEFKMLNTIGITAGASTPDSVIKSVENSLAQ
ncbi:MAG: 4-hydroxy-3-methylbut-2-enyl diphosphate reductase [Treponema sp.]|nr:4-hydroxy-3-methylbut-2-enyl diphosphate reductase [Candidatus Treponema merdequi]